MTLLGSKKLTAALFNLLKISALSIFLIMTACAPGGNTGDDSQVNGKNVNLKSLEINEGNLLPKFTADDVSYNLEIPYANTSAVITATVSDPTSRIEINGTPVVSGESFTVQLTTTSTTVEIRVIASDNTTSKGYSLTIFRAQISHNADLSSLEVSNGTLTPGFDANTLSYSVTVPYSTGDVDVSAIPAGVGASVSIKIGSIFNSAGSNTITATVTAQDGTTKKTYTVVINRGAPDTNANLADLTLAAGTLSPQFSQYVTSYKAMVENSVESITVRPTVAYEHATVKVNGNTVTSGQSSDPVDLAVGSNTITVEVTAEDGQTTNTYTVNVQRLSGTGHNADLASLSISTGAFTPLFDPAITEYSADVLKRITSLTVTPEVFGPNSTVTVNGVRIASGSASQEITLNPELTVIAVAVTAEDKTTTKTYTITINKATSANDNANLAGFTLTKGTLLGAFDPDTLTYYARTADDVESIQIIPVAQDANAMITVNGEAVVSGIASQQIALVKGNTTKVEIIVIAEDGYITKTYTINIKRIDLENWSAFRISNTGQGAYNWISLASSSDGTKLIACAESGYVYISSDSGSTWVECISLGYGYWKTVASSSDGTRLAVAEANGYIYTSTDSGTSWTQKTSSDSRYWISIASSSDGTRLTAVVHGGYIYTSTDSGSTWTQRTSAGSNNWKSIASSFDGTRLAAATCNSDRSGGYIYTSADSGVSWTQRTSAGNRAWEAITSSSDGTRLAAVVCSYQGTGGYIYTSVNSGSTWTQRTSAGSREWISITSSSDGTKLAATVCPVSFGSSDYIYTSADSGSTWTQRTSAGSRRWRFIASSSDGTRLTALASFIYTSADSGISWSELTTVGGISFYSLTSSSDGTKLALAAPEDYIYSSADNGETWTQRTSAGKRVWRCIRSSYNGTNLIAAANSSYNETGYIYTSADSGETWTERTAAGSRRWNSVASSSDGIKLAASVESGYIYTSADSGETWTERTSAGIKAWKSIASSSDGTRLVAIASSGSAYLSADSGESWTESVSFSSTSSSHRVVRCSSDGRIIVVAMNDGNHISTDYGSSWTRITPPSSIEIAISADGRTIAFPWGFSIRTSTDYGQTWTDLPGTDHKLWQFITLSSDGSFIAAMSRQSMYIYICK